MRTHIPYRHPSTGNHRSLDILPSKTGKLKFRWPGPLPRIQGSRNYTLLLNSPPQSYIGGSTRLPGFNIPATREILTSRRASGG